MLYKSAGRSQVCTYVAMHGRGVGEDKVKEMHVDMHMVEYCVRLKKLGYCIIQRLESNHCFLSEDLYHQTVQLYVATAMHSRTTSSYS